MNRPRRLYFDIETQANPENLALMPDPRPPTNLKDPAKIEAAIAEKKAEQIEMAALDPDYGRVLSIGYSFDGGEITTIVVGDVYVSDVKTREPAQLWTEEDAIRWFWQNFRSVNGTCVGYNILSFDLPYLMRRSMYLGIKVPYQPVLARYRSEPVTDLMMILCNWDSYKAKGLKQMARLLGIPNLCPDVDGSKVKDLDPQTLRAYQESDVRLTIELFNRMNGIYFQL